MLSGELSIVSWAWAHSIWDNVARGVSYPLNPGSATTVRVIAIERNEAADGSKEVEFEM
jgi:hypothetical protein